MLSYLKKIPFQLESVSDTTTECFTIQLVNYRRKSYQWPINLKRCSGNFFHTGFDDCAASLMHRACDSLCVRESRQGHGTCPEFRTMIEDIFPRNQFRFRGIHQGGHGLWRSFSLRSQVAQIDNNVNQLGEGVGNVGKQVQTLGDSFLGFVTQKSGLIWGHSLNPTPAPGVANRCDRRRSPVFRVFHKPFSKKTLNSWKSNCQILCPKSRTGLNNFLKS